MALVEIEAGPHRVTAAITRDAVEELGLAPGVDATATVKATSVMVERVVAMRSLARSSRSIALVALAGCGGRGRRQPTLTRLRRGVAEDGVRGLRRGARRRDGRLQLRRVRRARRPDPQGREAGRVRRRQHEAARRAAREGPGRAARRVRRQPARDRRAGRRTGVASLDDLGEAGGARSRPGAPSVPVGSYTREVLARLPAREGEAIAPTSARTSRTSPGVVGKVTQGAVDAGFVYVTDVSAAGGQLARSSSRRSCTAASSTARPSSTGADHADEARLRRRAARGRRAQALARAGSSRRPRP